MKKVDWEKDGEVAVTILIVVVCALAVFGVILPVCIWIAKGCWQIALM